MKFSTQEEYGLRCLMAIAGHKNGHELTIPKIARMESLSEPHVAKLLMILRKAGFIKSTRGHTGGYTLARPAEEIVIGEALASLGGKIYENGFCDRHSGLDPKCIHESSCLIGTLWMELQTAIDGVLLNITLGDLLMRKPQPSPLRVLVNGKPERNTVGVSMK